MNQGLSVEGPIAPGTSAAPTITAGAVDAFTSYLVTADGGTTYTLRVRSSYLNSLPVTNADGAHDWDVGAAWVYYVHVTVDGSGVATAAELDRSSYLPEDDDSNGYQALFEVDEAGQPTSQHARGSLRHQMCAGQHQFGGLGS